MFEKLIGLSFVSLAADILLSKSSFKKYIKAVIGAMFVIAVISGVLCREKAPLPEKGAGQERIRQISSAGTR